MKSLAAGVGSALLMAGFQVSGQIDGLQPIGLRSTGAGVLPQNRARGNDAVQKSEVSRQFEDEVVELHRFFEDWFHGRLAESDESFGRLERALGGDFEMINPAGQRVPRERLLAGLRRAHGSRAGSDFAIEIRNLTVRRLGSDLFSVGYEEWQHGDSASRGRISTAVMRLDPQAPAGVLWLSLHETWME